MIHIRNQTTQLHRIYLPEGGFVEIPPKEDRTVNGDVRRAHAAHAKFGAVLVKPGEMVPADAALVFFDDTAPKEVYASADLSPSLLQSRAIGAVEPARGTKPEVRKSRRTTLVD